ncbi:hypothetical protein FJY94_05325 [Candidatus Kaiserbacteria bacterium]|nr:hypothetical protein [Candidatus Kaiserbacteria bacterium]
MSRVKLSEFRAKKLMLGDAYAGIRVGKELQQLPKKGRWVAKVDQGIKKRAIQGLVALDKQSDTLEKVLAGWKRKGFSQFLIEPFVRHVATDERYLSLERMRDGLRLLYAAEGGVDVEAHPEKIETMIIRESNDLSWIAQRTAISEGFLASLYETFERNHVAFLEINPLVVKDNEVHVLDAAVLVDSAGEYFVRGAWSEDDLVLPPVAHPAERAVERIAKTSSASFRLSVLNPDGALFFLLSGGGGSIVIADQAQLAGGGEEIGNYGEYSGGPSREETYLYAKEVVALALASKKRKKALVIAGGIANFTDVEKTFLGIIDALTEVSEKLRKQHLRVFVRRGGPNEHKGLVLMREFLEREGLLGSVYGSDAIITQAIDDAIHYAL